ncbi:HAD family hydrolase [Spiroplasma citri]|uniref:HAD family hydrolase n=1 Tax=Spiroplasma citri TaxID=2133 RepID=A0AAX3T061_SPICI|nr:HAD family hydrolase [Spiroplasma citri]WFG96980.1 HAD family hydrolase [Spiroplasma citri]WFH00879.1 HAD family hydrolase [Spiroplasma citri]
MCISLATLLAGCIWVWKSFKRRGYFNTTDSFEKITKIDAIAFDKTGTITNGQLTVHDLLGDKENIKYIYNLEKLSAHPIARSIHHYFANC